MYGQFMMHGQKNIKLLIDYSVEEEVHNILHLHL